jgi:plasmid stability protein
MTTLTSPTVTRRLKVRLAAHADSGCRRLRDITTTMLTCYRRDTGRVLAIRCDACHHWVKPRHWQPATGTCRRCARNRH